MKLFKLLQKIQQWQKLQNLILYNCKNKKSKNELPKKFKKIMKGAGAGGGETYTKLDESSLVGNHLLIVYNETESPLSILKGHSHILPMPIPMGAHT